MSQPNNPPMGDTCGRCPAPKVEMYAVGGLMPAQPGWSARFLDTPDPDDDESGGEGDAQVGDPPPFPYAHFDVLAYDGHGYAMVMDEEEGRLRRAKSYDNFLTLVRSDGLPIIRGYLPSVGGWHVRTVIEGGEPEVRPVVGWAMTDLSDALPIVADTTGARQAAFLVDPDDSYYREVVHIPPAQWAPTAPPTGRTAARPPSSPTGRPVDAQVGDEGSAHVGGAADAQPPPTGRTARPPKKAPTGRRAATPRGTPTIDDLSQTMRDRLVELGAQYPAPTEIPSRDTVIAQMKERGIPGFTNKTQVGDLVRILKAERARYAHITEEVNA